MTFRSRPLLDLCHELPCMAKFSHDCNGPSVPAHSNQLKHGRGHGHKSADWAVAATCPEAHSYIDGVKGGWDKETKHAEWERAHIATMDYLFTNKLVIPHRRG